MKARPINKGEFILAAQVVVVLIVLWVIYDFFRAGGGTLLRPFSNVKGLGESAGESLFPDTLPRDVSGMTAGVESDILGQGTGGFWRGAQPAGEEL